MVVGRGQCDSAERIWFAFEVSEQNGCRTHFPCRLPGLVDRLSFHSVSTDLLSLHSRPIFYLVNNEVHAAEYLVQLSRFVAARVKS